MYRRGILVAIRLPSRPSLVPGTHRTVWHAGKNGSHSVLFLTYLAVGWKRSIGHGRIHHSFLLNEKHAFLVLTQVRSGSLQLWWRLLLLGRLGLGLRLGLRRLLLNVGHQGVFVRVGHRGCHSRTQVRIKMGQRLSVAISEHIVLFV